MREEKISNEKTIVWLVANVIVLAALCASIYALADASLSAIGVEGEWLRFWRMFVTLTLVNLFYDALKTRRSLRSKDLP